MYSKYNEINSKDNERIKTLRKLSGKKYRNKLNLFCVENKTIVLDAFRAGVIPTEIFLEEEFFKKNEDDLKNILEKVGDKKIFLIDQKVNRSFSSLETPSGICAVYEKVEREIDFEKSIIYLNAISDPGNLGTIFRSTLAFGFEDIVLDENCVDAYNPKTIQASKGSIFDLRISLDKNFEIFDEIKNRMKIISTDVEKGRDLRDFQVKEKFCLVLGNETRGVQKEIQNKCDEFLNIKIDSRIESLNVSSSAAIIFYEFRRGERGLQ